MNRVYYMMVMVLCCALRAAAQDGHGDVVVHSDPRLAVLMKKKRADAVAALPKPPKKHTDIKTLTTGTVTTTSVVTTSATGTVPTNTVTGAAVAVAKPSVLPAGTPPPVALPPGANVPAEATPVTVPEAKVDAPPPVPARAPIFIHEKDERVIYTGKGFRVQIYSGADRERAINIKTEFMRNFPGVRTYLIYLSPTFRVKVGNYRTRAEAMSMYREAKEIYSPCVIVPDNITINTK